MTIETYDAECCRVWPMAVGYPPGTCGLCGQTPRPIKTPAEWCQLEGVEILDVDGWRDGKSYDEPLTLEEFRRRAVECTIRIRR